jgi:hypothetical protein
VNRGYTTEQTGALTRRALLSSVPIGFTAAGALASGAVGTRLPRIAAIVTVYRKKSHGQGIVDRLLDGYGWENHHHHPGLEVVSLYVDQKSQGDLTEERTARHRGLRIYPSIAEALTCGTGKLAVDGVLSIGEQGRYPRNEKGQHLYPRYEFFTQIVDVFERSGRCVPVFNDKHLSWSWDRAKTMVRISRTMGFPLMAGSSLPVTWRLPSVDLPFGAEITEAVCVGYGGVDSYDFHGLEALQCLVERRKGGETGVAAVGALRGAAVWKALRSGSWRDGGCDPRLIQGCLCRSFTLHSPRPGYGHSYPALEDLPRLVPDPMMYRIEYADGLKATLLMMSGLVQDFTVSVSLRAHADPLSTQMYLPGLSAGQTLPNFFSPLSHHIETLFTTGKPPYPIERTLLTTGILATAVDSLHKDRTRIETPDLQSIHYVAPRESTFWRS